MTERQWYAVKHTKTFSLWNSNFEKINGQVSSIHRSEKPEFSSSKLSLLSLLLPKGKLMLLIKWRDKNLMIFLGQWGNYGCWLHWYRSCQYCHDWGCWKHSSRSGPYEIGWCFQPNLYTIDFNCPNNYRKCLIFLPTKILIFATKYVNRICIWDFFGLFSKILFFLSFFLKYLLSYIFWTNWLHKSKIEIKWFECCLSMFSSSWKNSALQISTAQKEIFVHFGLGWAKAFIVGWKSVMKCKRRSQSAWIPTSFGTASFENFFKSGYINGIRIDVRPV